MCRWVILALVLALLGLSSPVLFRRNAVQIKCNAKAVAIAKRPSALAWRGNKVDVCVGSSNMFSMLGDLWTFPVFIYSFPDAERFLCIYDDDTAVLAFVVDSDLSRTNALGAAESPTNDYTRGILAQRATNVVVGDSLRCPTAEFYLRELPGALQPTLHICLQGSSRMLDFRALISAFTDFTGRGRRCSAPCTPTVAAAGHEREPDCKIGALIISRVTAIQKYILPANPLVSVGRYR